MEFLIEEEVLRVADRGGHAAQIGSYGLKDDNPDQMPLPPDEGENQYGERDKGNKGYIVCDKHGAEKGKEHQRQREQPHPPPPGQQPLGQNVKEPAALKSGHDSHQAEEQDEDPQVDI